MNGGIFHLRLNLLLSQLRIGFPELLRQFLFLFLYYPDLFPMVCCGRRSY